MSIQLFIGHSGQRLELDSTVTSLDGLRAWVAQNAGIQARNQILLTAQGKQVRQQTLLTESELFVFDSSLFASKEPANLPGVDALGDVEPYSPGTPPDTIANQNDLQAWQTLFSSRKSWASALLGGCSKLAAQTEQYMDEEAVIARCLGAAVASLQQHIKSGEKKYNVVVAWADETLREQEEHVHGWEHNLDSLRNVPARAEFARFLHPTGSVARRSSSQNDATLQVFVDVATTHRAASAARDIMDDLTERLNSLQAKLEDAAKHTEELLQAVDQVNNDTRSYIEAESEASQLRSEIEIMVNKISSDLEHVQSLPRTSQSAVQASKMALLHTRNYLPNLGDYCQEMNDLVERARERRQQVGLSALEHMQTLSSIESRLAELYTGIEKFGMPEEDKQSFANLTLIGRIPSVYGQLLVESVRRREWVAKMKRDSSTLQEEMATYQEEEEKRRKKWTRSVEDVVNMDALQLSRVLGIELSMQNEGGSWPVVTREELQEYLNTLLHVYGEGPVAEEMELAIKDLDKPTRKQIKHAKAFKNGSMHEAAFGDTSLMLRGDEQFKSLRDMNARLEDEVKGQKSRVRKLEDLLHRSTQMSRGSADMFSPQSLSRNLTPPLGSSPQPSGELSRNGSTKHRRLSSAAQGLEEKKLARRVVDLEAELHAAKEEAKIRKNSDAEAMKQVEEAVSTKKDLMENMEAQQKEFAGERRNLEAELKEAREKLEEAETEIERLMGSRDDERSSIDGKLTNLEDELERYKQDAAGHAARAANEHDARSKLEKKLEIESNARTAVEEELQKMKKAQEEQREAEVNHLERLATAHAQLSPDAQAPSGIGELAGALEELTRRSAAHAKDLADVVALAKADNENLQANNDTQKSELTKAKDQQTETEARVRQLQERLDSEEAKSASLHQQLGEEQTQLQTLRNKFAEGETGSEVLRQRVTEEEARVGKLSSQLAESQSHANSLDVELTRLQKEQKVLQASTEAYIDRLEKRAGRAKEISHKLFSQHARFTRLLERLGLAISYQDDAMVVERASKLGASTMTDQGRASMITSPPPTRKSSNADETADLSILRWADAQSAEDETNQYASFLESINRFNVDTFVDAIVKRVRDFEYTARKFSREQKEAVKRAEAYKDRAQRLRIEAHTKIAVRDFKEGDMALFLPTRGQAKGAWAAFNIGCPHYFLAEREGMRLGSRDFIVARISKVEQKVVDLNKTLQQQQQSADGRSIDEQSEAPSFDDDNPFELSDGLTWWMVHATEERGPGAAPTTPGLGKSTVAAANVDARGSIKLKRSNKGDDASKHLNKSLDSRRSSSTSKKGVLASLGGAAGINTADGTARPRSDSQGSLRPLPGPASAVTAPTSGLGIVTTADNLEEEDDQENPSPLKAPPANRRASEQIPGHANAIMSNQTMSSSQGLRPRSRSPSKSVRSLQRHLADPQQQQATGPSKSASFSSPAKPQPQQQQQQSGNNGSKPAWESLWSAEYSLESPGKKKT